MKTFKGLPLYEVQYYTDMRVLDVLSILEGILRESPKGLVSLNFGLHACIHMGTEVDSKTTASPPTRQSINILLSKVPPELIHGSVFYNFLLMFKGDLSSPG
jgi:hypothetical protein